jgi:hypothetical protein
MDQSARVDFGWRRIGSRRWRAVAEVGLIFLVFFIQGAWPAPEVNEPHYLSKAKHYWDASWCAHDFFCGTADAHQVFDWTFGWLSRWLSLPAMAWCGRILTWGLLAWAWRRLSVALGLGALYAVLAAALFVAANARLHMAGEWIIGGVEAKGFAYVLVLLGLESLVCRRWTRAVLLFGAASSFHVIVGGWSVVAAAVVWLTAAERPPLARLVLPLAGGLLLALPGLLPAVALTWRADAGVVSEANRIYVFERLDHHLLPQHFPPRFVVRHLALVGALVVLARLGRPGAQLRKLHGFVAATVAIAAVGMIVGLLVPLQADLAASLLRYYWFRMSDVMVPLGVAVTVCVLLEKWTTKRSTWPAIALGAALFVAGGHLGETIWRRHLQPLPPADVSIVNVGAWREMCAWIAAETPADAVFLTPRLAQTFRWYAQRAEVVSRKDIPQDAAGIVQWWQRMNRIHRAPGDSPLVWRESMAELGSQRLRELGAEYGADYVLTAAFPALNLERVGPVQPSFALYRLPVRPARATNATLPSPDGDR